MKTRKIFVINAGSSSIKYQLFDMPDPNPICVGQVEKIGGNAEIKYNVTRSSDPNLKQSMRIADHREAMEYILDLLTDPHNGVIQSSEEIEVVGHRIVHGGEKFVEATVINEAAKNQIRSLFTLAPLHNPVNFACLELAQQYFPKAIHVAIFDTAFHQTLAPEVYRYAIPENLYRDHQIRVYGFHGTSHHYVCNKAADFFGSMPGKIISIHLGNGCSITAVKNGRSVDTSMGFGPLAGLIMGTRSGDIDASVIFHLADELQIDIATIRELVNKNAGLIGLTGTNDMREISRMIEQGNQQAKLAIQMYVYRIKKYIGAYVAIMNGVDAMIFTAGVGENDVRIRSMVCADLDYLGIRIDENLNMAAGQGIRAIHDTSSRVQILVVPTNEELEIAGQCYRLTNSTA